jgi:hypothetical protein
MIDEYDVTGQNNEWKAKRDAAAIDVTVFGDRFSYDLAGIQKASIEYKGFYGPGQLGYHQALNRKFGQDSDVLLAVAPQGWGSMLDVIIQPSVLTKYDLDVKLKGAVDTDVTAMARGAVDNGYQFFHPLQLLTTTGGSGGVYTSPILNDTLTTGATAAGAALQVHAVSVTGSAPSALVEWQSSPDGSTWTDVVLTNLSTGTSYSSGVPAFTAVGKGRWVLPKGNNLDQQLRSKITVTGSGSIFQIGVFGSRNVVYS